MNLDEAKAELKQLLSRTEPTQIPKLLHWIRNSDQLDELLSDNRKVILQNISEELRQHLPAEAMLPSETAAHAKMQQRSRPTVHVDSFLFDEDEVDARCEEGTMSRSFCLSCGSYRTAPLGQNRPLIIIRTTQSVLSLIFCSLLLLLFFRLQTSSLTPSLYQSFSSCSRTFSRTSAGGCWWMWAPDWEQSCTGVTCSAPPLVWSAWRSAKSSSNCRMTSY
ncbi:uncharacterized protein zgc:109986 [Xyrichtys novacula]|uniref:Uncharacterized protein zgc:109986 n=1 Tax=Xyrichtys novacula TaxID=13765 RepID=A0AAV1GRA2_XYRNO|nr:uncharacterized protein zgc:109986 [Xyrichtys novacula]